MKAFALVIGVAVVFVALRSADATPVLPCTDDQKGGGTAAEIPEGTIIVGNCNKPPCRLRRKSAVPVEFRFKPTHDTKTLKNEVHAKLLGIPFPFLGVDNTSACNNIYLADGITKVGCPLKANTDYVYKSTINVLEIYPKVRPLVHWALVAEDGSKPVCFHVAAKITS